MSAREKMCYVIMPFSKTSPKHTEAYWTKHWNFLRNKIEECPGVKANRSKALRGDIVRSIITDLYRADIVVADLTDKNPNVYWELGVRQSFKHGTVTIAEYRHKIASDMGMKSVLRYYPRDSMKNEEFIDNLKEAIKDCIENPKEPDSNVLETLGGRGTIYQIINKDESIRRMEALVFEVKFNIGQVSYWQTLIEDNKGKSQKDQTAPTVPLYHSAIELLVVNRYLDEKDEFYSKAMLYLGYINACNAQLQRWREGVKSIIDWFEGPFDKIIKPVIIDFLKEVTRAQQHIALM